MALPRSPCRRWRGALRFPNGGFGDFPPRPAKRVCLACESLVPCLPLRLSGAGRGLRWLLVRVPLLRAICGHSARDGGDAGGDAAQNRARQFRVKQVCSEVAALGFPRGALRPLRFARALDLRSARLPSESPRCGSSTAHSGGRRPLSFVSARKAGEAGRKPREGGGRFCEFGTTPRTINRPRGLRRDLLRLSLRESSGFALGQPDAFGAGAFFSRRRDAARTLRGRFAHGERIVLAPVRARVGHLQGRCGDGASGAVGV